MSTNTTSPRRAAEIAQEYLAFYIARGHTEVAGASLAASGGDTLFTVAGMQPFIPYFRGERQPPSSRLTNIQRCLRTVDVDGVGSNGRKLTSFLMLGNWSIGDYNRREAIHMAHDLLHALGLDFSRLWITTFAGDPTLGLPPDEVTVSEWRALGIPLERITPLGADDNLWTIGGPGPCGPCTELFVDQGVARGCGKPDCRPGCACERFLEIGNLVFIEQELLTDGSVRPLPLRSVDVGMGLERLATVLQGVETIFDIDLYGAANTRLRELATGAMDDSPAAVKARRIILDHTRTALYTGLAGVAPGRDGQQSVVRRLMRRAARQGRILGLDQPFLGELIAPLVASHGDLLTPDERERSHAIAQEITTEEGRFARVLTVGLRALEQAPVAEDGRVPGAYLFQLHAERGFPADLAREALAERGLAIDWDAYEQALAQHQSISRGSAEHPRSEV